MIKWRPAKHLIHLGSITVLVILLALAYLQAFFCILSFYDFNEDLYMVAGWMVARGYRVYVDFPFWQMPYSAWLYGGIFKLFQPENFLLTGKLTSFFFWICVQIFLGLILGKFSKSKVVLLLLLNAVALNGLILRSAVEASNYIMSIAFSMAGLYLLICAFDGRKKIRLFFFLSGIFWGLAIGTKLYYLPLGLVIPLVIYFFGEKSETTGKGGGAAPFLAGIAVVLLPVAVCFLRDPGLFWLNNVEAHSLTRLWWQKIGSLGEFRNTFWERPLLFQQRLLYSILIVISTANGIALFVLVAALCISWRLRLLSFRNILVPLAGAILFVSLVSALVPAPTWEVYMGMPMSFVMAFTLVFLGRMGAKGDPRAMLLAAIWLLASLGYAIPGIGERQALFSHPDSWPVYAIHEESQKLASLARRENGSHLLCFHELFAIESHYFVPYPGMAYAPFTWVIADSLSASERRRANFIGPEDLDLFEGNDAPECVLVGVYPQQVDYPWREKGLQKWAEEHGYVEKRLANGLRGYFKPGSVVGLNNP